MEPVMIKLHNPASPSRKNEAFSLPSLVKWSARMGINLSDLKENHCHTKFVNTLVNQLRY